MSVSYTWNQMLDDFRALGGTAENIEQRRGQWGNGLFPIDPQKPVVIAIPAELLIDSDHLTLDGDDLVVGPQADAPDEVREFINRYQKYFSWGAEGRRNAEDFEKNLKTLPDALLTRLRQARLINLEARHKGSWPELLRKRFLQSRRINYHDRQVSMPIIELINHSSKSPGYAINNGIQFKGRFSDEITVNYSPNSDALLRFFSYGFASQEPGAYSLPMHLKLRNAVTLHIGMETSKIEPRDKLPLPKAELDERRWKLAHLRVGMERAPRMPRTILRKVLPDLTAAEADEVFERIRGANLAILTDLLELTLASEAPLCMTFRRALIYQIKAMSHCFGVRPEGGGPRPQG